MMCVRQAEDEGGGVVAVKALSLRRMAGWKALELFEREAATLKGLDHPAVPRYVDYFEQDNERDRGFFLVQARGATRGRGGGPGSACGHAAREGMWACSTGGHVGMQHLSCLWPKSQ